MLCRLPRNITEHRQDRVEVRIQGHHDGMLSHGECENLIVAGLSPKFHP